MADLLLSGLGLMPAPRRKERTLRLPNDFSLRDFTDKELRSRYRFGRESIEFLSELLCDDLERDTSRNHTLSTTVQVLVALRFFASRNRNTETRKLHQVAIDRRRYTSKQTWIFFYQGGFPGTTVLTALTSRFRQYTKTKTILSIVKGSTP